MCGECRLDFCGLTEPENWRQTSCCGKQVPGELRDSRLCLKPVFGFSGAGQHLPIMLLPHRKAPQLAQPHTQDNTACPHSPACPYGKLLTAFGSLASTPFPKQSEVHFLILVIPKYHPGFSSCSTIITTVLFTQKSTSDKLCQSHCLPKANSRVPKKKSSTTQEDR